MDQLKQYQQTIKQTLQEYVDYINDASLGTDDVMLFDDQHRVYAVFGFGWQNQRRIQIMIVLMRIVADKIYVEDDNTDYGFVDRLLEAGIPANQIVLAWQAPEMRVYTEFAHA